GLRRGDSRGPGPVLRRSRGRAGRRAHPLHLGRDQGHRPRRPQDPGGPRLSRPRRRDLMKIDVFTLFPGWFDWFRDQRHVRNALGLGHELDTVDLRATTPLSAGQVDDTPYGGGAGMVIRVDVVEEALRVRYGGDPLELRTRRRVIAL